MSATLNEDVGHTYVVTHYQAQWWPDGRGCSEFCTIQNVCTGRTVENVTCTGMGLEPGDELIVRKRGTQANDGR